MTTDQLSMFGGDDAPAPKPIKTKAVNLSVSRTITAPAEKIFDHWLIPVFIENWMFCSHLGAEKVLELNNEVRPGGEFSYRLERHGKELAYKGEYQLIDRPKQLKFSWQENNSASSTINVSFEQLDAKTKLKVTIQLDPSLADDSETIKQQWSARCKALAAQLSK